MTLSLTLNVRTNYSNDPSRGKRKDGIVWSKLRPENLDYYSSTMETALDLIPIPSSILHGTFMCNNASHNHDIETYFDSIIDAMSIADSVIKRTNFRALKPFWSPQLSTLKRESFVAHQAWVHAGKPRNGTLYDKYLSTRSDYRKYLRLEKRRSNETKNEKLFQNLMNKDSVAFWRS